MRKIDIIMAVSALAFAAPALAVQYQFVVFDPTLMQNDAAFDGNSYTFFFDSSPTPVTSTPFSFSLTGSASYSAGVYGMYRADGAFTFYTDGIGFDTPLNIYFSDQLFTGDTSAPTFRLGTFQTDLGRITISEVGGATGAVPEPAAWTMMIAGFGLVGTALRSRRPVVRFAI